MRNKINATNNINEQYVECHVSSIIAMCLDYATSFTVFRHDNSIHIDISHSWVGFEDYKSYTITVYKDGAITIAETTEGYGLSKVREFDNYGSAMETIFNAIADTIKL